MMKNPDSTASPRWVAKDYGFELLDTSPGEGEVTYSYQHPVSGIGLLISVRPQEMGNGHWFDWSIHKPQTHEVVGAEWDATNGISFLRKLIHVLADADSVSDGVSEEVSEDFSPKEKCISCGQLRVLNSTGHCDYC